MLLSEFKMDHLFKWIISLKFIDPRKLKIGDILCNLHINIEFLLNFREIEQEKSKLEKKLAEESQRQGINLNEQDVLI